MTNFRKADQQTK